jgi:hypothetical protein
MYNSVIHGANLYFIARYIVAMPKVCGKQRTVPKPAESRSFENAGESGNSDIVDGRYS